jgi:hypothetical protein
VKDEADALAEKIIGELFTAGDAQKTMADRIVLMGEDGRDLGGWGVVPAVRYVAKIIREHTRKESP